MIQSSLLPNPNFITPQSLQANASLEREASKLRASLAQAASAHDQQVAQLTAKMQTTEREGQAQMEAYQSLMQQLEEARAAASSSEKRTKELEEVSTTLCSVWYF